MTKFEWDRQLKKALASLPQSEQKRVVDYYNELFEDKIDANMREQEIVAEFGNPYDIANRIIVDYYNDSRGDVKNDAYVFSAVEPMQESSGETQKKQSTQESIVIEKTVMVDQTKKTQEYSQSNPAVNQYFSNRQKMRRMVSLLSLTCVFIFFFLGAFFSLWHPAWMIFVCLPLMISIIECVIKRNWRRFNYPIFIVVVYLCLGIGWGLWHPMWFLFITIPFYYTLMPMLFPKQEKPQEKIVVECEKKERPQPKIVSEKPQTKTASSVVNVLLGILVALVFIYIAIIVWVFVLSMFTAGIGVTVAGIAILVSSAAQLETAFESAILYFGMSLALTGIGFMITFGFASLFKPCVRMIRLMGVQVGRMISPKRKEAHC